MASNIVKYILQITDKGATKSLKDVGKASEKTSKDLKKVDKRSKDSVKSMKALAKSGKMLASGIAAAGAALLASGAAVFKLGQQSADLVNSLNDMETRSGVAAESIQALQFAFVASGQEASAVQGLLDKMPKMMGELARGTGSASVATERLGVSVFDAAGKLKDSQDLFVELTEELQKIESGTERATIAAELFGRQAGNMLQAFGQTEGLGQFMKFTESWGLDVGEDATRQAAQFQQAVAMLDVTLGALAQTFANVFGQDGMVKLIKWTGGAIVDLGTTIEAVSEFIQQLFDKMGQFGTQLSMQWEQDFARASVRIAEYLSMIPGVEIDITDAMASLEAAEKRAAEFSESELSWPSLSEALDSGYKAQIQFHKDFDNVLSSLQKEGKATGSVIGEAIGEGATEAKDAWKEFFDVLDDYEVDFSDSFDQIAEGINEALQAMMDHLDRIVSNIEKAAGVLSGIASGDIVGAASQFMGPVGGAVAGGVSAISDIGQRVEEEGTEFIKLDIENFVRGFIIGLAALPAILLEALPPILFEVSGRIINAIIMLPFHIGKAIVEAWQSMGLGKEERQRRREEFGKGANLAYVLGKAMEATTPGLNLGMNQMMSGGRFIPSAMSGMRFTGSNRGLAMLHENEYVVPASGQMPQSVGRQFQGGGGITININADIVERNAIDELVRRIERQFDLFGTSTSPLFNRG